MHPFDQGRHVTRNGEGGAVTELEVQAQELVTGEWVAPDLVPPELSCPLVNLGPKVELELSPRAGRGRHFPVDPRGVTSQGEPQDGDRRVGRLAKPVGTSH